MSQQREVTSAGGWFCWFLLLSFVPIIGTIIMLCSTKDPTAKNYAKLTLIMQIIGNAQSSEGGESGFNLFSILGLLFVHVASAVRERREAREHAIDLDDES